MRKQISQLKRSPQTSPGSRRRGKTGEVFSIQGHRSAARSKLTGDQIEVCGLACTVRADDGRQCAGSKSTADGIDGNVATKANREVIGCQQGVVTGSVSIQRVVGGNTGGAALAGFAADAALASCVSIATIAFICGADFFAWLASL